METRAIAPSINPNPRFAESTDVAEVTQYFPLRAGYVWTYIEQVIAAFSDTPLRRHVTLTIQSQLDHEYIGQWNFQSGQTRLPNIRYRIMPDGVQQAQLTGDTAYTPFVYMLKAPLVVGTTWRGLKSYPVHISAVGLSCTVPAGVFDRCIETLQDIEPMPENRMLTRRRFAPTWEAVAYRYHGTTKTPGTLAVIRDIPT
jgi:hypothetical protein